MTCSRAKKEVGLADAALALGVSWGAAWRLLLIGRLDGRKDGRTWKVTRTSVERLRALRRPKQPLRSSCRE